VYKLKKYIHGDDYMLPNGKYGHEVMESLFPGLKTSLTHVITTTDAEEIAYAVQLLSALRHDFDIDPSLSEDAAIQAIEDIRNAPPEIIDPTETVESRTAAALEQIAANGAANSETAELLNALLGEE
jgi:hypothetical protein